MNKKCGACKKEKPLSAFRKQSEAPDNRRLKCKDCEKAQYKQQKLDNAEYAKKYFTF